MKHKSLPYIIVIEWSGTNINCKNPKFNYLIYWVQTLFGSPRTKILASNCKFIPNKFFISKYPSVVTGLNKVSIACCIFDLCPVIVNCLHFSLSNDPNMSCLTRFSSNYRFDTFRPPPTGFQLQFCNFYISKIDYLGQSFIRFLNLISICKWSYIHICHDFLPTRRHCKVCN